MKQFPFFRLKPQHNFLREKIDNAIQNVLEKDCFILGQEVAALENEFADFVGARFAVGVASGTDAITLALWASGVKPEDEVITAANTATPTAVAISRAGARPIFADIESRGFQIDPQQIEKAITPKTKAILPVHLYGQPADMDLILEIGNRLGIPVIEDACQAHGAIYKSKKVGSLGRLGCFSFYPTKNLGCLGDGGMVTTQDESLYHRLLLLRNYGQKSKYEHVEIGINSRLDELQAAVLRVKLNHLDRWNQERKRIANCYSEQITHPSIVKPENLRNRESVYHIYPIRCQERDALKDWLESHGVVVLIHYPIPIHLQKVYAFSEQQPLPNTEHHAKTVLSLPVYPELPLEDIREICDRINRF